jgi:hypothetical protein
MLAPVTHTCNIVTQEDHGWKLDQANSSQDPILKKPITYTHKRSGEVALGIDPEIKPQSILPKKNKNQVEIII